MEVQYDKDYYERGVQSGKSCYVDYRWIPELTIPMAMAMIDFLDIKKDETILDFGCAKGYLVKAFRLLHRKAWGCDCSKYAIDNVDTSVQDYCSDKYDDVEVDICISKDVFEHIHPDDLSIILSKLKADSLFVVVPLGDHGKYVVPAYHMDKTHVVCENEYWWEDLFRRNGWKLADFRYRVEGIKDNWSQFPRGNGFFTLQRE